MIKVVNGKGAYERSLIIKPEKLVKMDATYSLFINCATKLVKRNPHVNSIRISL